MPEPVYRKPHYRADPESLVFGTITLIVAIAMPLLVLPWALLGAQWVWALIAIPELFALFIAFSLLLLPVFTGYQWSTWEQGDNWADGVHVDAEGRPVKSTSTWRGVEAERT